MAETKRKAGSVWSPLLWWERYQDSKDGYDVIDVLKVFFTAELIVFPYAIAVVVFVLVIIHWEPRNTTDITVSFERPEMPPLEFDCKLFENFTESIELKDKVEKIETLNGVEIKKDSEEWNDIYSRYVVESLDAAIKSYCKVLNESKKKTRNYMKRDVRNFFTEYTNAIKKLNEIMPKVERESTDEYKITVRGFTVRHNSKNYTVS